MSTKPTTTQPSQSLPSLSVDRVDAVDPVDAVDRVDAVDAVIGDAAGEAAAPIPDALLSAQNVTIQFGGLKALSNFNLKIRKGDLQGLIGPNGAGKTTAFNVLTGVYQPTAGEVFVASTQTNGRKPHQINRLGVARTFQNIRLFKELSVIDNVRVARLAGTHAFFGAELLDRLRNSGQSGAAFANALDALNNYYDWWRALFLTPGYLREEETITKDCEALLDVMGLLRRSNEIAKNLPYGEQRRLEIARALATRPKVLLLDEPAAGMNPKEKVELMELIRELRDRFSLGILLIEHDMKLVMGICEKITVLDHGESIARGTPEEVRSNRKVIEAYLGESSHDQPAAAEMQAEAEGRVPAGPPQKTTPANDTRQLQDPLLEVRSVSVSYGAVKAIRDVSLVVGRGEVVALIGGNGAGKSTTLRAVSGMVKVQSGTVRFDKKDSTSAKSHELVPRGLAHAPEGRGIFLNLTVEENLDLGAYLRKDTDQMEKDKAHCFALFPVLEKRRKQVSGTLSGGEQQMLSISRALMSRPKLLLLDEPSLGLAPQVVEKIFGVLADINKDGVSILLVEQNAHLALNLAHYAYVLETGEIVMSGSGKELLTSPEIRKAYLGE